VGGERLFHLVIEFRLDPAVVGHVAATPIEQSE
jgi:hypothetical protein